MLAQLRLCDGCVLSFLWETSANAVSSSSSCFSGAAASLIGVATARSYAWGGNTACFFVGAFSVSLSDVSCRSRHMTRPARAAWKGRWHRHERPPHRDPAIAGRQAGTSVRLPDGARCFGWRCALTLGLAIFARRNTAAQRRDEPALVPTPFASIALGSGPPLSRFWRESALAWRDALRSRSKRVLVHAGIPTRDPAFALRHSSRGPARSGSG